MADNTITAPRGPVDMADQLPTMSDAHLKVLKENVERLSTTGSPKQLNEAARLLPLIVAEIAARKAAEPPKPKRAAPVRKAAVKKPTKAAAAKEAAAKEASAEEE